MIEKLKFIFAIFLIIFLLNCSSETEFITKTKNAYLYPPLFLPSGGEFGMDTYVEIFLNTSINDYNILKNAKIVYTKDGTNPQIDSKGNIINGFLYTDRILITGFTILKAVSYIDGVISDIGRTAYSFKAGAPIFNPSGGTYDFDQIVEINTATLNSTIYYTTDGSNPTQASNVYVSPLTISSPVTLKAIVYKFGWAYSETREAVFNFQVALPIVYPGGGIYDTTLDVVLSPSLIGSEIRYTLDGNEPTNDSTLYTSPILIDSSKVLKSISIKSGMLTSNTSISSYILKVKNPYPSIGGGYYKTGKSIELKCDTIGSQIKYKLVDIDNTTDLTPDTIYTVPINISLTKKLTFMATKASFEDSEIIYESYYIDGSLNDPVNDPIFSHNTGTYNDPINLSISSSDGSFIKYTLDGSTPSINNGFVYDSDIYISETTTVKAVCLKDNYAYSNVVERVYTISNTVEDPQISLDSGTYDSAVPIEMDCNTSFAVIRWTINGSDPTENDYVYTGPISVTGSAGSITFKARAFRKDWTPSNVVTRNYDFKLAVPVFNPQSKSNLKKPLTIVISQSVLGSTIYYTDDGTDPKTSGTKKLYSSPFSISSTKTIKAYATYSGWQDSDVATETYTFE